MTPAGPLCLADYEALALAALDPSRAAYLFGGSADEVTLRANRDAFDDLHLHPRVLRRITASSTQVDLFGTRYAAPVLVAPMGYQQLFHPEGETATARAAAAMGLGYVLSTLSSVAMERVAEAGEGAAQWFQLYLQPARADTLALLRRAEAAGFAAIVVTVDAPINGLRNREMRAGFALPPDIRAVNLPAITSQGFDLARLLAAAPVWDDIAWLRGQTRLPLIVKGILHPEDAAQAVALGADALVVSNHGGRTLDTACASIAALPDIAERIGARVPLLLDGGIRRGTDVLKALALGASAVLVGRPVAAALVVAGAQGAAHALRILREEFAVAMALCGCTSVAGIAASDVIAPAWGRATRPS